MSTRSVIARPTPDGGFYGAYCHNDGYPAHQGRILFDAVTGHFDRHEPPRPPLTDHTARAAAIDYAYVLGPQRLRVLTNHAGGWQPVAEPAWTEQPDWDAIDTHAQHLRRGW